MITFITAFYSTEIQHKPNEFYFKMFEHLASTNINIMLYLDDRYIDKGEEIIKKYKNVNIEYKNFKEVKKELINFDERSESCDERSESCDEQSKSCDEQSEFCDESFDETLFILPDKRNPKKDTLDYLFIQLSKLYHMAEYANKNKESNITHIAWIDFGIFHIIKEIQISKMLLKLISKLTLPKDKILIPGSWPFMFFKFYANLLFEKISWFLCGGFMIGDINLFNQMYEEQKQLVYQNLPKLTWEVNYWALIKQLKMTDKIIIIEGCDHNDILFEKTFNYINDLKL